MSRRLPAGRPRSNTKSNHRMIACRVPLITGGTGRNLTRINRHAAEIEEGCDAIT